MMPFDLGDDPMAELTDEQRRRFLEQYAPEAVSTGPVTRGVSDFAPMRAPTGVPESEGTTTTREDPAAALMRRFAEAQQQGNRRDTVNAFASGLSQDVANFVNGGSYGRGTYRASVERDPSLRSRPVNDLMQQEGVKQQQRQQARQSELDGVNLAKTRAETRRAEAGAASTEAEAAREAALSDPKSPESAALRSTATELLKGRVSPETLGSMSGVAIRDALKFGTSAMNAEAMADWRNRSLEQQDANAAAARGMQAWTGELQWDIANLKAAQDAEKAAKDGVNRVTDQESKLRNELLGLQPIKEYQLAAIGLDKVRTAASDPSAAGDLAMIFGYMKTLDPTSTVREGEFANAQNAAGVPDRIRNVWNKARTGERLSPQQRAEFISSASGQFKAYETRAQKLMDGYKKLAAQSGLDPSRVLLEGVVVGDETSSASPAPFVPAGQKSSLTPSPSVTAPASMQAPPEASETVTPAPKMAAPQKRILKPPASIPPLETDPLRRNKVLGEGTEENPYIISVKGKKSGYLRDFLQDGEVAYIREDGGRVVQKVNGKVVYVDGKPPPFSKPAGGK